jgi:hypothetical protein
MGEFGAVIGDLQKVGGISAVAILLLLVWLFASGRVRPQKHLDEFSATNIKILEHKDKEIEWWREAYEKQSARGDKQEEALRECLEVGRATLHALEALSRVTHRELER